MGSMECCEKNVEVMSKEEACSFALSIVTGSTLHMVLKAVIELDVLEIIDTVRPGGHLSPVEIAARLPSTNLDATANMLDRMLRLLASNSLLSYSHRTNPDGQLQRLYGPSPVTEFLTKSRGFGPMLLLGQDKVCADSWCRLKDAVLEGSIAFDKAHGMNMFEYLGTDIRFNKVFNNAMTAHSTIIMEKLLENYKGFEGISRLIDVGGGTGATLNMIVSKYPQIKGVNFDLPQVIKNAPAYDGVEHVAGDMFARIPTCDAIFMKWICHDWSDEDCLKLLKNCYVALPDHGKVILCEYIVPVAPETNNVAKVVFSLDAKMMVNLVRGKERTEQEFEILAKGAGFHGFAVVSSAYDLKVMELSKTNE